MFHSLENDKGFHIPTGLRAYKPCVLMTLLAYIHGRSTGFVDKLVINGNGENLL